jgi:hypothetical protein
MDLEQSKRRPDRARVDFESIDEVETTLDALWCARHPEDKLMMHRLNQALTLRAASPRLGNALLRLTTLHDEQIGRIRSSLAEMSKDGMVEDIDYYYQTRPWVPNIKPETELGA